MAKSPPLPRVLVCASEFPPAPYGVSVLTMQQCRALAARFEVGVVAPREQEAAEREEIAVDGARRPIQVRRFPTTRTPIVRLAPFLLHVRRAVRAFRPALLYCPQYRGMGPVVWLLARLHRIPYVAYWHGTEILTELNSRPRMVALRRFARGAAVNLTNSRYTADLVRRAAAPRGDPRRIPPGIDSAAFEQAREAHREGVRAAAQAANPRRVLLTVGRIDRRKALDVIVDALSLLREKSPSLLDGLDWWIVGAGPERVALDDRLRERLGVAPLDSAAPLSAALPAALPAPPEGLRVVCWGLRPADDVRRLMGAADLFVLASRDMPHSVESFGMVYLEANAAGVATIGAATGGVTDAIEDGVSGLLVPPDDPAALAESIASLLRDATRRQRLASQGRDRARDEFDWEVVGPQLCDALTDAIR